MKIKELFESSDKHVTFCFGRMNPPTIGHKLLFEKMKGQGGDIKIFVSKTQDSINNPLDYPTKLKFLKNIFPEYASNIVDNPTLNTFPKVCSFLYSQGYNHVTFVAGDDRLYGERNMYDLIKQYNGVEGKGHGYYKFDTINAESCGQRCPDSDDIAGISATKARADAANGDFESFAKHTGAGQYAEEMYHAVRKGLGINMKASDLVKESKKIPAEKPRNFVAKNAKMGGAGAHKDKKKAAKQGDVKHKQKVVDEDALNELSNEKLGQYKKAASDQASAADKAGDYEKGNKRFRGIIKATKKQFANDTKVKESIEDRLAARIQQYLK